MGSRELGVKGNDMGWFGHDIMDGDTPMDIEGLIQDVVGINLEDDINPRDFVALDFDDHFPAIMDLESKFKDDPRDHWCFFQVLGHLMLEAGARSLLRNTPSLRDRILWAIRSEIDDIECDDDDSVTGWTNPERRVIYLKALRERVKECGE